jgi:predicted TIM-barrel fold metal-dependent hydrolase
MKIIAIEEHWNTSGIRDALGRLPDGSRDESVAHNDTGDNNARLEDIGDGRIRAMDTAGIDVAVLSVVTPATQALSAPDAVALAREANDRAAEAVRSHPERLRAFATLPTPDPQAAAAELERCAGLGHVGAMVFGRTGSRPLDDPAYDDLLATAARLRQPLFIHPQIPSNALRDAAYRGLGEPELELALATFGWGWHMDAGLAALRLILSGAFDRHPDLQIILGHFGEMLLFAIDRANSLSHVAPHLQRRVADYVASNFWITNSGMMQSRLLRHTLDFTGADRIMYSTDYPFHQPDAAAAERFLATVEDPADRAKIAWGNAASLFAVGNQ